MASVKASHIAAGSDFNFGSDAHRHSDARTVAAGHGHAILVFAKCVVLCANGVVHRSVRADIAACEDYGRSVDLYIGVSLLADDAGDFGSLVVVHEFERRRGEEDVNPCPLGFGLVADCGCLRSATRT